MNPDDPEQTQDEEDQDNSNDSSSANLPPTSLGGRPVGDTPTRPGNDGGQ